MLWSAVHEERRRLADDLERLSDADRRRPSLCPGWDVHDVVAHLVDSALATRRSFVVDLLRARGDFDQANERGIARHRRERPRDTCRALRDVADHCTTPPAPLATRLVEAVVHGEDVRRPLRIERRYPAEAVRAALEHQLGTSVRWGGGRERAASLRLVDRASGDSWGEGPEVVAEAVDLLLAVSGRPIAAGLATGPGASRLLGGAAAEGRTR